MVGVERCEDGGIWMTSIRTLSTEMITYRTIYPLPMLSAQHLL